MNSQTRLAEIKTMNADAKKLQLPATGLSPFPLT
jgi:hypothetical protein